MVLDAVQRIEEYLADNNNNTTSPNNSNSNSNDKNNYNNSNSDDDEEEDRNDRKQRESTAIPIGEQWKRIRMTVEFSMFSPPKFLMEEDQTKTDTGEVIIMMIVI